MKKRALLFISFNVISTYIFCQSFVTDTIDVNRDMYSNIIYYHTYKTPLLQRRLPLLYYNIRHKNTAIHKNSSIDIYSLQYYPRLNIREEPEIIRLIEELMAFKGDERLCIFPTRVKGMEDFIKPVGDNRYTIDSVYCRYSLQVQALYLITQLQSKDYFKRLRFPIICDYSTASHCLECNSISGKLVEQAWSSVERWLVKAKSDINRFDSFGMKIPINDSTSLTWYSNGWMHHKLKQTEKEAVKE